MSGRKKAQSKKNEPPKETPTSKKEFVWSDDESEQLLNIMNDYKVKKVSESTDYESVQASTRTFS